MSKETVLLPIGTTKTLYTQSDFTIFYQLTTADFVALKNAPAPRGHTGAIALGIVTAADGSMTTETAGTVPTVAIFVWNDTDASHENVTTIFVPGYQSTLADTFTVPTYGGSTEATVTVTTTNGLTVGDNVYIGGPTNGGAGKGAGVFEITEITDSTTFKVVNNAASSGAGINATDASTVAAGYVTICPSTGPVAGRWMKASGLA